MLEVSGLSCGYGDIVAVRDLSFSIGQGKVLALLGANGAGKSSTLMCLVGLVARKAGRIVVSGRDVSEMSAEQRITHGIAIVPEGRRIFPDLTVRENLMVGGHIVSGGRLADGIEQVYGYFPQLKERKAQLAGSLSGGEQQMLAMGRALMSGPKLLLVDELSLGLMPKVVDECYEVLHRMKTAGMAIVLVEQSTERALAAADEVCVLEAGNLSWSGTAAKARANENLLAAFLGQ